MSRPVTTPEMVAEAHKNLRRIAELEQSGMLTRITGFGQLDPQDRLAVANGTYEAK